MGLIRRIFGQRNEQPTPQPWEVGPQTPAPPQPPAPPGPPRPPEPPSAPAPAAQTAPDAPADDEAAFTLTWLDEDDDSQEHQVPELTGRPLLVRGERDSQAAGIDYYPKAYRGMKHGQDVIVDLVPEPSNEYDPNAVMVIIKGTHAGFLSAGAAKGWQPLIIRAQQMGLRVQVPGQFVVRHDPVIELTTQDLRLFMPTSEDFDRWLSLPGSADATLYEDPAPYRFTVTLKRLNDRQELFEAMLHGDDFADFDVRLDTEVTPSGKYQGQTLIHAFVGDALVGSLPAQYRSQAPMLYQLVEDGVRTGSVRLRRYDERISARLTVLAPVPPS